MIRTPINTVHDGFNWYVLRVRGAFETKAALNLELHGAADQIPDYCLVRQLWIPYTTSTINSKGVYKTRRSVLTPGYIFIHTILSNKLYATLKDPDIPHVFGWLQRGKNWPAMVTLSEIKQLACLEEPLQEAGEEYNFTVGEKVSLPSMGITGYVTHSSYMEITLDVDVFSRKVPFVVKKRYFPELVKL